MLISYTHKKVHCKRYVNVMLHNEKRESVSMLVFYITVVVVESMTHKKSQFLSYGKWLVWCHEDMNSTMWMEYNVTVHNLMQIENTSAKGRQSY